MQKKDGNQFFIETSLTPFYANKCIWTSASIRDITERKFGKKVIEKNMENKEIFECVSHAFVALDKNWNYTYVNDIAYENFKRPKGSLVGKNIWDEFPENIGQPLYYAYHKAMETQQFVHIEEEYLPWNRWFENSIYPSSNGLSIYFKDITERKKTEQLLIKEKEISDSIINSLPGIFYLFDGNGQFLLWNKNFETITGYSGQEISKMHPLDLFDEDEKNLLKEQIAKVFIDGKAEVEAHIFTKDKKKIPYCFNGHLIQYNNQPCLNGMGIDISESKKAEYALKKSEEKYKLLFENNPLPMWIIDVDTLNIMDVNEAAINHYGYTREEFLHLNIRNIRPPEEVKRLEEATKLEDQSIRNSGIWTHIKKDGTLIKVEITSHDLNYQNLKTRLILSNDVTDKVNAEQTLTQLNKELRKLYAHQQEIREEERKHIAREIHDELGQIITGVKMDVSWLRKKINTTNPELKDKLDDSIVLLDEAVKTVRKISSELRPSILDDLGLIAALQWQSQEFEKRTNISCLFISNVEDIDLEASYKSNIFRIYQESLTNIIRHAQATQVNASLHLSNQSLTLTIKDNGRGFNVETQTNTLGLMGMKERALMVNGEFYINSKIGEGTECKIVISIT